MDILTEFKVGIAHALEKEGSSIEEFEQALANNDVEKIASIAGALGSLGEKALSGVGSMAAQAPEIALTLSVLAGTLGGGALYGLDSHLGNQDKRLGEKQKQIDQVKNVTDRLKADYNIK